MPAPLVDQMGLIVHLYEPETFEHQLDLAAEIGALNIEITQSGRSEGVDHLLSNHAARLDLADAFRRRGLRIAALNCSGMPLHPVKGAHYRQLIEKTMLLAEHLQVDKVVSMSSTTGDAHDATVVNWVCYPWPEDSLALLERQWESAILFWGDMAALAHKHGVRKIAFELHPMHLVYNVPTLQRMRQAVGPIIGANVDPSHLFWQQMDPVAVVRALGPAVLHVQLKDAQIIPEQVATVGVLDQRPLSDPTRRSWIHRTIGRGHGRDFWQAFLTALGDIGYADGLSIENEDPFQSYDDGVREAAQFLRTLLRVPATTDGR
jgi:sugar phosphate isomerase/epimerase